MTFEVLPDPAQAGNWLVRMGTTDQSHVNPDDPTHLEFDYMQRIAVHLDHHAPAGERYRVVHLGGAGLTLARYLAHTRPTSPQIVCEPNEALTAAVREHIPLPRNSGIKVRPVDGRSGVAAMPDDYADVVIIDAFTGARVPADLVTAEFFADVRRICRPTAQVLMNVTDTHPFTWTRRVVAGLRLYFSEVSLSTESATLKGRRFGNVVIGASRVPLPIEALNRAAAGAPFPYRVVVSEHLDTLVAGAQPFHDGASEESPLPPSGRLAFL